MDFVKYLVEFIGTFTFLFIILSVYTYELKYIVFIIFYYINEFINATLKQISK